MFWQKSNKKKHPGATSSSHEKPNYRMPPSVVSADMNILGNLVCEGEVDIDGHIAGNVKCREAVIRRNGVVKGDVVADEVQIFGEVRGLVKGKTVFLASSARVEGVIMHEAITIEDGAFVDGQFKRTDRILNDNSGNKQNYATEAYYYEDERPEEDADRVEVLEDLQLISQTTRM